MSAVTDRRIRERVKALRERAGLSQRNLAQVAGVSLSRLRELEQGVVNDPRVSILIGVARALGVGVDDLLKEGSELP